MVPIRKQLSCMDMVLYNLNSFGQFSHLTRNAGVDGDEIENYEQYMELF